VDWTRKRQLLLLLLLLLLPSLCPTCDVEDGGTVRLHPGPCARPGVQQLRGFTPQLDLLFVRSLQGAKQDKIVIYPQTTQT